MKLTTLAINENIKKSYNKPQALELSVQTTAGGSTEPVEAMMGTATNRKVNTGS